VEGNKISGFVVDQADWLILLSVLLPPAAMNELGMVAMERTLETPFGMVGPLALRRIPHGPSVWILPYTGAATRTDPRATIYAAHMLGVRQIVAWDTVIALNPVLPRGQVAVMADYVDFTRGPGTFDGAPPSLPPNPDAPLRVVCPRLTNALRRAVPFAVEIVYVGIDGPRRESAAEARIFRQWGADVVGQNMIPEAALAQEAGICFAGMVTVAELSAERTQTPPRGEVRASLEATLTMLPAMLAIASAETCDCLGTVPW
jgi:5'-methylthioadenosine phosphorylase